ncbi:MAG TPA: hypothetical protein VKU60_19105 [Chloroflexota bacterium]|nr:hypothetical protein [Chloroflexota bacterium]
MKLPLETISGTIWAGIIIAALLALVAGIIPGGWMLDVVIILIIWLVMFGLLVKPTPPKT